MVNSTTPRLGPRCPPDTDTFSTRNALIDVASFVNSSRDNPCRSRGSRIRPRTSAELDASPVSSRSRYLLDIGHGPGFRTGHELVPAQGGVVDGGWHGGQDVAVDGVETATADEDFVQPTVDQGQ